MDRGRRVHGKKYWSRAPSAAHDTGDGRERPAADPCRAMQHGRMRPEELAPLSTTRTSLVTLFHSIRGLQTTWNHGERDERGQHDEGVGVATTWRARRSCRGRRLSAAKCHGWARGDPRARLVIQLP